MKRQWFCLHERCVTSHLANWGGFAPSGEKCNNYLCILEEESSVMLEVEENTVSWTGLFEKLGVHGIREPDYLYLSKGVKETSVWP